jgi:FIST N domain.
MKIASGWSTNLDAAVAAEQAYQMVRKKLESVPHLLLVHSSSAYDNKRLIDSLAAIAPGVPIHGGTSCLGVMTEEGFHSEDGLGIGILGVFDPDGSYGVGAVDVHG